MADRKEFKRAWLGTPNLINDLEEQRWLGHGSPDVGLRERTGDSVLEYLFDIPQGRVPVAARER